MVVAEDISRAREKQPQQETTSKLHVGNLVFVCDPDSGIFEPGYSPNYQIITTHRSNIIEVQDEKGHKSFRRAGHVKKVKPVDIVCQQLTPEEIYKKYGRACKLLLHPKDIPDIELQIAQQNDKSPDCQKGATEIQEICCCHIELELE